MRQSNQNLAARRQKKQSLLPQIAQLAREGFNHRAIGEKLVLTKTTVGRWLKEIKVQGSPHSSEIAALIARHIERYELMFHKALAAWDLSQSDKQTKTREDSDTAAADAGSKIAGNANEGVSKTKRSVRLESRTGDVAYLKEAMDALKAIERLHGVVGPQRSEAAGSNSVPVTLSELTPDQIRGLSNANLAALKERWDRTYGQGQATADTADEVDVIDVEPAA